MIIIKAKFKFEKKQKDQRREGELICDLDI